MPHAYALAAQLDARRRLFSHYGFARLRGFISNDLAIPDAIRSRETG